MKKFKIIKQETVINEPYCHIEKQRVVFPNGKEGDWFLRYNADAAVVVVLDQLGRVMLQRVYKHGSEVVIVEFCAGMIEPGESPETGARRELLEETGFVTQAMKSLGECYSNPTGSNMKYHFFLAEGIEKVAEPSLDDAEQIEVFWVDSMESARKMLLDGSVHTSAATLAALGALQ